MSTGIFFHYQQGERLKDFPDALDGILDKDNVFLYDAFYPKKQASNFDLDPIPQEKLHRIHSEEMVERVKVTGDYEGALFSAAGTVAAALRIWSGEITNAFVFTGFGDHHAGSHFFGGGCYFNGAAIAVHELRERFDARRFSIIDTDAHHGDGTWELFKNDPDVLYICFCSGYPRENNQNVNIHVSTRVRDHTYLALARDAFERQVEPFRPDVIFWNWGYDGTTGEYGDIGLSPEFHLKLALEIRRLADQVSGGRLVVILCGGSGRGLASFLIPRIIKILASQ